MGIFDGTIKKFAAKMTERLEAYAAALEERASRNVPGNHDFATALALRLVAKSIKEVAEAE